MGGTLKGLVNPTIAGTGQTASDLSKLGYSGSDMKAMDPKGATWRGGLKGALGGLGAGLGQQQGPPQGGGMIPQGPAATPVDPSYFAPQQQSPWGTPQQRLY